MMIAVMTPMRDATLGTANPLPPQGARPGHLQKVHNSNLDRLHYLCYTKYRKKTRR